jgi:hypothetical protein
MEPIALLVVVAVSLILTGWGVLALWRKADETTKLLHSIDEKLSRRDF